VEQAVGDSSVSLVLPAENTQVGLASCVIGASDTSWRPNLESQPNALSHAP
jgi:hypothetical protein